MGKRGEGSARSFRRLLFGAIAVLVCLSPLVMRQVVSHAAAAVPCPPISAQTHLPANLSYVVPQGFVDGSGTAATGGQVDLQAPALGNALESIRVAPDDPPTNVTGYPGTIVGGLPAFVVADGAGPGKYGSYAHEVVVQCDLNTQFVVICRGMPGYDPPLMSGGCFSFLGSLSFPPVAAPGPTRCPTPQVAAAVRIIVACDVPRGYHVVGVSAQQIVVAAPSSGSIQERITLSPSPPPVTWNYTGHTRITIAGCPAYVMNNDMSGGAYVEQVVLDCARDGRYSIQCQGFAGFDLTLATGGCASFLSSVHTTHAPQPVPPSSSHAPAGTVPGSVIWMPISVALFMGVWLFAIVRFLSWLYPIIFRLLWPYLIFRVIFYFTVASFVLSVVLQPTVFGEWVLVFWPILAVAFGLEILYRTIFRRLIFSGGPPGGLLPPPPPPPPPFIGPPYVTPPYAPPPAVSPIPTPQSSVGYGRRSQTPAAPSAPASILHPRPPRR